jgi:multidrug resistance efflux pump
MQQDARLTFRSPVAGVVTEKKAVQGMRFMPGETLFQIADTSTVWVQADVFEQDIAAVNVGQKAKIRINAYPGEDFRRAHRLRLSDAEGGNADGAGAHRTGQSRRAS